MARYFTGGTRLGWLERLMMDPARSAPDGTYSQSSRSRKKPPRKRDAVRIPDQTNKENSV